MGQPKEYHSIHEFPCGCVGGYVQQGHVTVEGVTKPHLVIHPERLCVAGKQAAVHGGPRGMARHLYDQLEKDNGLLTAWDLKSRKKKEDLTPLPMR